MKEGTAVSKSPVEISPSVRVKEGAADVFEEFRRLSDQIAKRAYDLFQWRGFENGHDLDDWFAAERELLQPMPLELKETDSDLIVTASIPGFDAKDLDVRIDGTTLTIRGQKETNKEKKEDGKVLYSERRADRTFRSIELPVAVKPDAIRANLTKGTLEIAMPKAAKPSRIEVKAS